MTVVRFFLRFMLGVMILLILAIALAWVFRAPLTEQLIRTALARSGYQDTNFDVRSVSGDRLQLENVTVGKTDAVSIERVDVTYAWRDLLGNQRIRTLIIGPGRVRAVLDDAGQLSVPGLVMPGAPTDVTTRSAFDPANLPLDQIEILPITLELTTPRGLATGLLQGQYTRASGGAINADFNTPIAGISELTLADANANAKIDLAADGSFMLASAFTGNIQTRIGAVDGLSLTAGGNGRSWIDIIETGIDPLSGEFQIDLTSAKLIVAQPSQAVGPTIATSVASVEQMLGEQISGTDTDQPIGSFELSGSIGVEMTDGVVTVRAVDNRPLLLRSDLGDRITLSAHNDNVIARHTHDGTDFSFFADIASRWISFSGNFSGTQESADAITLGGKIVLPVQILNLFGGEGKTSIKTLAIDFTGNQTGDRYFAQARFDGEINKIDRAPIRVQGLKLNDVLSVSFLPNAPDNVPIVSVSGAPSEGSDGCLDIRTLTVFLGDESLDASADNARLCANGKPLLTLSSLSPMRAEFHGNASAKNVRYDHGDASLIGRPPAIVMNGQWDSATEALGLSGTFAGGDTVLNRFFRLTNPVGSIGAQIVGEEFFAETELTSVRIAQATRPVMINAVIASGKLTYRGDEAQFEGQVSTPAGTKIGNGIGVHNLKTGRGKLDADFAELIFLPDDVQPAQLLPGLGGIIANATGSVWGTAGFGWSPTPGSSELAITSHAEVTARDLAFAGPGRAVTSTGGVNGTVRFIDLFPAKSDGIQSIEIGYIDLDAIRLADGIAKIEFPGDDTVSVNSAEFPWFGGTIGAYDTIASLTGEQVSTALRANNISLGDFLAFLEIPGLSGEGEVAGTLPIIVDDGKIRVEDAVLRATRPGVIRFDSELTREIAKTTKETQLAFDVLRELSFKTLEARISGALDGQLKVGLVFEGINTVLIGKQRVPSPVIYRITIEGPLPNLISQRMQFSNFSFTPTAIPPTGIPPTDDLPEQN